METADLVGSETKEYRIGGEEEVISGDGDCVETGEIVQSDTVGVGELRRLLSMLFGIQLLLWLVTVFVMMLE